MYKLYLFLFLSFSVTTALAKEPKTQAQYTLELLDGYCIQNQNDFNNITLMISAAGGKLLPDEMADPVIRERGGRSHYISYNGNGYIVGYANGGACSVVTKNIDVLNLKSLLIKHFQIRLMDKQPSLAQVSEMHEVTREGDYKGAIISLVYAQPETGYLDGSISFIPARHVKNATNPQLN
jgi:hypothetical protein